MRKTDKQAGRKLFTRLVAIALFSLAAQGGGCGGPAFEVVPVDGTYAGLSYPELAAKWWQWALTIPKVSNPLFDQTGAACQTAQQGPVFFLAGYFADQPVAQAMRSCTIPADKALFFPLANSMWATDIGTPEVTLRMKAQASQDKAKNMASEIDGIPVPDVSSYRTQSIAFSVTMPEGNYFEDPPGHVRSPCVDDGVYLLIKPLSPGAHDVHLHGEFTNTDSPDYVIDVGYHLNVQ